MFKKENTGQFRFPAWAHVAAVAALSTGLGTILISQGRPPVFDELYHILAAGSWSANGTLAIADGTYDRAWAFTEALGGLYRVFGESIPLARALPLTACILWTVAIFAWTRSVSNTASAWICVLLFSLSPTILFVSDFVRFYSLHGLMFWLGATACYELVVRPPDGRAKVAGLLVVAIGTLLTAVHLQVTTMIGLVGVGTWAAITAAPKVVRSTRRSPWFRPAALVVTVIVLLGAVAAVRGGVLESLWRSYRFVPLWNAGMRDEFRFYHWSFVEAYPTLWTLLPLAFLIAFRRFPTAALYTAIVFCVGIVLHSFAGSKGERYVVYLLPFFFIVWGMAIVTAAPVVKALVVDLWGRLMPAPGMNRMRLALARGTHLVVLMYLLAGNHAFIQSLQTLAGERFFAVEDSNWSAAVDVLEPLAVRSEVILTTNSVHAVYYLGDYDFEISGTTLRETDTRQEFGLDRRTGRRVISSEQSLELVLSCFDSGLFVGDNMRWRNGTIGIGPAAADLLRLRAEEISLPREWGIRAFRWEGSTDRETANRCPDLPREERARAA